MEEKRIKTNMNDTTKLLDDRFAQLPEAVQNAITSANVAEHLKKLSDSHQLHFDQWQELETEVMMTLMGIKPVSALKDGLKQHVRVDDATAQKLSDDISHIVFAPVREELERFLSHPSAKQKEGDPIKDMTGDILKSAGSATQPVPAPRAEPQPTVARRESPATYKSGETSAVRKDIHSDPYRIAPDA